MKEKRLILNSMEIDKIMKRLASQIIEVNPDLKRICLIGIKSRGVPMANRFSKIIKKECNLEIQTGILDISLYRDDLSLIAENPIQKGYDIDFDINNKTVLIIDDVLYTGKTVLSAIQAIYKIGNPAEIQLCVLIDRGHRTLPVYADFIGKTVPTSSEEIIKVAFKETDSDDFVKIMQN